MRRRSSELSFRERRAEFAERILPRASDLWIQASLEQRQRFQGCTFLKEFRSTVTASLEPP
jgi:hypothetical protein